MGFDDQTVFEQDVDTWTRAALANNDALGFAALVAALPGVYPSQVWASVERLATTSAVSAQTVGHLRHSKGTDAVVGFDEPACPLPLPHPLDFDWRFSYDTVEVLLKRCADLSQPSETIVLLGTPRLAIRATHSSCPRRFLYLDRNPAAVAAVAQRGNPQNTQRFDAMEDAIPCPETAAAVCIDPPWYLPQFRSFLWVAAALCRLGGHVLCSIPAVGTRPRMATEWQHMQAWADRCGLSLIHYERSALTYVTPPFEMNALRAGGFSGVSTHWRRSDFAVFARTGPPLIARPSRPEMAPPWQEFIVSGVAFRTSPVTRPCTETGFQDPRLRTLVPGDILPSVSARDQRRAGAEVWTTGNRIFGCAGSNLLHPIIQAVADNGTAAQNVAQHLGRTLRDHEHVQVLLAVQQIKKLVTIERNEQANGFRGVSNRVATPGLS